MKALKTLGVFIIIAGIIMLAIGIVQQSALENRLDDAGGWGEIARLSSTYSDKSNTYKELRIWGGVCIGVGIASIVVASIYDDRRKLEQLQKPKTVVSIDSGHSKPIKTNIFKNDLYNLVISDVLNHIKEEFPNMDIIGDPSMTLADNGFVMNARLAFNGPEGVRFVSVSVYYGKSAEGYSFVKIQST